MKKVAFTILALFVLYAFQLPEDDVFPRRAMKRLLELVQKCPQEKVYLHTDRDHYEAGDKVWFRAYLTNAYNHRASALSRFVYVELRDRQDSLYARIKVGMRDSVLAGFVPLDTKLSQGDYFLRAYSYWMQNGGDDFIFRKKIRVLNPRDSKVQSEVTYQEKDHGKFAQIRFYNSRQEPYDKVYIDYEQGGKTKIARTDDQGCILLKIDTADFGKKTLVKFKDADPFDYVHYVYLPDPTNDFEVAFMPEGGDLLSGCQQTVAFKAIGKDGLSRKVSGVILDENNEQIAFAQSLYKGMGAFDLNVEPGHRYHALFTTSDSLQKRFELPVPKSRAVGLKVVSSADVLGYIVQGADSARLETDLYIMVHSRGVPIVCQPTHVGARGKLLVRDLPEGILSLVVMNGQGDVYSQRLCFVRKQNQPEIVLGTDKPAYGVRDQVYLNIQIDADSTFVQEGSFSIAVTDDEKVERDSLQNHILSSLLLTSDLKGYIEEPAYYFRDNRIATRRYLDLLMLTQGWTRFDVQKVIHAQYDTLKYYLERGQAISGKVKNFWGKDATNANLILLSTSGLFRMVDADTSGHFVIDGIAFPDSTKFVLQGKSKKGRKSVEVVMDEDEYLQPSVKIPYRWGNTSGVDDFYKRFSKDYYYDNGIKVYVLDEAVVKRKVRSEKYSFYSHMADYSLDSSKLVSLADLDIRTILQQEFPGVEAWGDSVTRFGKGLYLLVNDFEENFDYVLSLRIEDMVCIDFIRPPVSQTFWGEKGANGVIVITTSPNFVLRDKPKLNMATFSLLGYQKKAEFYMPHYEVDSIRLALADTSDRRPTIYWNPDVKTDAKGHATCFFTTSDSYGPYSVIIEGILNDGTICRKEEKIKLKSW